MTLRTEEDALGTVPALRFTQWLDEWESYDFDANQQRARPQRQIYLFSLPAVQLRSLSGVYRRKREGQTAEGLQRFHDEDRSRLIRDFVRLGYPYGSIRAELRQHQNPSLRKPGWLPTAIVVNILTASDRRRGRSVDKSEVIQVVDEKNKLSSLKLPYDDSRSRWSPKALEPIEIIDGQHRLWAFDESVSDGDLPGDFELPVVAFHGLDVGWQAYLFWSINVSPKRINPSHAFDLYPLLRSQDWLEAQSELKIYREARAQELTELAYLHPESPWFQRINMLGESAREAPPTAGVTQAGWVRSLASSYLGPGGRGRAARGLFAADVGNGPLDWQRSQQAALLVELWRGIYHHISEADPRWARLLRVREKGKSPQRAAREDPFSGTRTILNQEQGVRGVLAASNEILFDEARNNPDLFEWDLGVEVGTSTTVDDVTFALKKLRRLKLAGFLKNLSIAIAEFDWRSAEAPNLSDNQRLMRRAFRGSGGYVALREQLLAHLASSPGAVGERATALAKS